MGGLLDTQNNSFNLSISDDMNQALMRLEYFILSHTSLVRDDTCDKFLANGFYFNGISILDELKAIKSKFDNSTK